MTTRIDDRDIELISIRVTNAVEASRKYFIDDLSKTLVPAITTAVMLALTAIYDPKEYGVKGKGWIDWPLFWTNVISWAAIGIIAFLLAAIFFFTKAHL